MKMVKTEGFDWWVGSRWNEDGAGQSFKLILVKLLTSQHQPLCISVVFNSIKNSDGLCYYRATSVKPLQ